MAPKKLPYSKLSKSAKYFRNPKNKASLDKKNAYNKEYHSTPERRKYRSELVTKRRKLGIYGKGGKDVGHVSKTKTKLQSVKSNRGNKKKFIFKNTKKKG